MTKNKRHAVHSALIAVAATLTPVVLGWIGAQVIGGRGYSGRFVVLFTMVFWLSLVLLFGLVVLPGVRASWAKLGEASWGARPLVRTLPDGDDTPPNVRWVEFKRSVHSSEGILTGSGGIRFCDMAEVLHITVFTSSPRVLVSVEPVNGGSPITVQGGASPELVTHVGCDGRNAGKQTIPFGHLRFEAGKQLARGFGNGVLCFEGDPAPSVSMLVSDPDAYAELCGSQARFTPKQPSAL